MARWLGLSLVVGALALAGQGCGEKAPTLGPGGGPIGDGDVGDGDGDINDDCGAIEKTAELERGPIDIILALDSSGSMAAGICNTSAQITKFTTGVGPDTHVTAVYSMTDFPAIPAARLWPGRRLAGRPRAATAPARC